MFLLFTKHLSFPQQQRQFYFCRFHLSFCVSCFLHICITHTWDHLSRNRTQDAAIGTPFRRPAIRLTATWLAIKACRYAHVSRDRWPLSNDHPNIIHSSYSLIEIKIIFDYILKIFQEGNQIFTDSNQKYWYIWSIYWYSQYTASVILLNYTCFNVFDKQQEIEYVLM